MSLPILMVDGFYLLLTNTDIVMLQHFRSPDDVAVYYAAAKTLALIAFVHFAVSAAVAHRFSEYHVANDRERLQQILDDSIRWTFWASLAATARHPGARLAAAVAVRPAVRRRLSPDASSWWSG